MALWVVTDDKAMACSVKLLDEVRLPGNVQRLLAALEKAQCAEQG